MTLTELQNSIRELGGQIRAAAETLAAAAADPNTPTAELTRQRDALDGMNKRMAALQSAYNAQHDGEAGSLPTGGQTGTAEQDKSLRAMLKSNEYARAFADALRTGVRPSRPMQSEKHKVLYDALTIGGGTTPGEDGGFLVPEDIDHSIRERRRDLSPLADLFNVETTSSNSGWRVVDTAPTVGMTALTSEVPAGGIAMDDQPEFGKVTFAMTTYGLIIPVSNELASDEVANLFGYLANWFAKKQVLTENLLLKAQLEALASQNIDSTADPIAALKSVLNKGLDPAISLNAVILTNQDGFDFLDQQKDETGRPMLQPDPTSATTMLFKGRRVKMMGNNLLPSRTVTTSGSTKGDYFPVYVGDFKQLATLFQRQYLEVTSTDVGGNAFRSNSIEVRGLARMCVSTFDTAAAVRREIFTAATA